MFQEEREIREAMHGIRDICCAIGSSGGFYLAAPHRSPTTPK
jgi:hypothetical protein